MNYTLNDICALMEAWAPPRLAEEWDNVGLMLGEGGRPIKKVLVALDLTDEVTEQSIKEKADLIITHHPPFFKPLKNLVWKKGRTEQVYALIRAGIAVYSAHTNLDAAPGGVNDCLAAALGLRETDVLRRAETVNYKLAVFVPVAHCATVTEAMHMAGAGNIGAYAECAYFTAGHGQFRPLTGSEPFVGTENKLSMTEETKVEVLVPGKKLTAVLNALYAAHPYEEPAYDVYAVRTFERDGGLGKIGVLSRAKKLEVFAGEVKKALGADNVYRADAGRPVYKVAVCGGSGTELIEDAVCAGADTFVTADVKYHTAQEAVVAGLNIIDAGHQSTEFPVLKAIAGYLQEMAKESKIDLQVKIARESILLQAR